jgi:carbon-monoxide dehydrogenase medium subunit
MPMLALRLAVFEHLVDIRRIGELRGIEERPGGGDGDGGNDGSAWIGAGTTEAAVGASGTVARHVPLLARATPLIGHFQIRNRGTIGGSLAHADAAAEYPAVALALDAAVEALSPRGPRTIPAAEFFAGIWTTSLEPDELLTGVTFPPRGQRAGYAIEEFAARRGDFAIAGAAVAVELGGDGTRITRCGIGLFGLGPTPLRATAAEASLTGAVPADVDTAEAGRAALGGLESVPSDLHGSADYRRTVGAAMVATALGRALREAAGQDGGAR